LFFRGLGYDGVEVQVSADHKLRIAQYVITHPTEAAAVRGSRAEIFSAAFTPNFFSAKPSQVS
jgi:hypothetical protein